MTVTDRRPTGLLRLLLRTPIWLYRARLGWLTGHRLLYIAHRGRRTGLRRETIAEVVHYDPTIPEAVVIAAWGHRPDWYHNLRAAPALEIRLGAHHWPQPDHRFPDGTETQQILRTYQQRHPHAWKRIAPLLGFPADPTDPRWSQIAETVHAIAFTPHPDPATS